MVENILFLFTGVLGLVVISIMFKSFRTNQLVNLYLFLVIVLAIIRSIVIGSFGLHFQDQFKDISITFRSLFLLNAPFLYLYFKSISNDTHVFNRRDLLHLVPPTLFFIYLLWYVNSDFFGLKIFKGIHFTLILTFMAIYLWKSYQLLSNKVWKNIYHVHIQQHVLIKKWTLFLFAVCVILFLRVNISFILELKYDTVISGKTFYIVHSLIWITLFAKLLISPEILFGLPHLSSKITRMGTDTPKLLNNWNLTSMAEDAIQNQQDVRLKDKIDERILEIVTEIEDLVQTKHFFRNQKMTINEMANELGVPVSHLVYVFKYHSQLTFTEFRTFMRIEDAKEQIKQGFLRTNTLESLAIEVGFSSYNPFFTAFKKSTGVSPNEYSNNLLSK